MTALMATALLWVCAARVQAGPPLSIDDPGILQPGELELITAVTGASTDSGELYEGPLLDLSLGLIEDQLQVSASLPYVHADPDDGSSSRGFGNPAVSVKWRVFEGPRLQLAVAPTYAFGTSRERAERGLGSAEGAALLAVNAEYRLAPRWQVYAELGYLQQDDAPDAWRYGAAVAIAPDERWALLLELAGNADDDLDHGTLEVRVGFDFAISDALHLLGAIGTGVHQPGPTDDLKGDFYLGLQLFR